MVVVAVVILVYFSSRWLRARDPIQAGPYPYIANSYPTRLAPVHALHKLIKEREREREREKSEVATVAPYTPTRRTAHTTVNVTSVTVS